MKTDFMSRITDWLSIALVKVASTSIIVGIAITIGEFFFRNGGMSPSTKLAAVVSIGALLLGVVTYRLGRWFGEE